ncbi:uncharacterized protein AMSG_01981 [Thecamonas trahens ATCC 50062]|uniref:Protein MON2 homolog n=1 Tax=Thecamonas trahens ATCC 50062 TaxID=461836 RepID=A0A0L0DUT6_THETB|nr:hypothetical protein AMSG_01981 [Thecamonas trahens ATCC 50062]KNC55967.1 hypothetical protein AMSG_01981 [Thecamonas trahens ATCC 50062]|eukprot:XP_013761014.1 hypothetical protein AMSG_01981 [Thecamonas trahens ATCC 50062]
MDTVDIIDISLRTLSTEARKSKKHGRVKEAAERGILQLRSLSDSDRYLADKVHEVIRSEEVLRPYLVAATTSSAKLVTEAISGLQVLASHDAIVASGLGAVVSTLAKLALGSAASDEALQVKVVQALNSLITSCSFLQGNALAQTLDLGIRMSSAKSSLVRGLAVATLRQMMRRVFEKVAAEDGADEANDIELSASSEANAALVGASSMRPCARDALQVFHALVSLTNGENATWLASASGGSSTAPAVLARDLGLELLEVILLTIRIDSMYLAHPELTQMLQEAVCPLLIRNFSQLTEFSLGIRLFRVVRILVASFGQVLVMEVEILVNMLFKLFDAPKPQLALLIGAMEVLHSWMADPQLAARLASFYDCQETSTNVFTDSVAVVSQTVTAMCESKAARSGKVPHDKVVASDQMPFLDLLSESAPPRKISNYALLIGCRMLASAAQATAHAAATDPTLGTLMLAVSWRPIRDGLLATLALSDDADVLALLVPALTTVVHTAGVLGESDVVAAVLAELAFRALPRRLPPRARLPGLFPPPGVEGPSAAAAAVLGVPQPLASAADAELRLTHVVVLHALLELATRSPNVLGAGWRMIMALLHALDIVLDAEALAEQSASSGTLSPSASASITDLDARAGDADSGAGSPSASAPPESGRSVLRSRLRRMRLPLFAAFGSSSAGSDALAASSVGHGSGAAPSIVAPLRSGVDSLLASSAQFEPATLVAMFEATAAVGAVAMEQALGASPARLTTLDSVKGKSHKSSGSLPSSPSAGVSGASHSPLSAALAPPAVAEYLFSAARCNMSRLELIWEPLSSFAIGLTTHEAAAVRMYAVRAFTSFLTEALQDAEPALHPQVLGAFRRLASSKFEDTHLNALSALLEALQGVGETFDASHAGWPVVLDILGDGVYHAQHAASPTFGASVLALSFRCVQFVLADFLEFVPADSLDELVAVVGAYAAQSVEVNISLTAVGALWRIADYLKSPAAPAADRHWIAVFGELGKLAMSSAAETRNCAVRTLFKTLTTHGLCLSLDGWASLLPDVVFAVLRHAQAALVALDAADAAPDSAEAAAGATPYLEATSSGDKPSFVRVHHSRDTPAKLWRESLTLILEGLVSIYRSLLGALAQVGSEAEVALFWSEVLDALQSAAAGAAASGASKNLCMVGARGLLFVVASLDKVGAETPLCAALYAAWWEALRRAAGALVSDDDDGGGSESLRKGVMTALMEALRAGTERSELGSPRQAVPVLATLLRGNLGCDTYLEAQGKVSDVEREVLALASELAELVGTGEYVGLLLGALEARKLTQPGLCAALGQVDAVVAGAPKSVRARACDVLVALARDGIEDAAGLWVGIVAGEDDGDVVCARVERALSGVAGGSGVGVARVQEDGVRLLGSVLERVVAGSPLWEALCQCVATSESEGVRSVVAGFLREWGALQKGGAR